METWEKAPEENPSASTNVCVENILYTNYILWQRCASGSQDNSNGKRLKITLNITTLVDLFMTWHFYQDHLNVVSIRESKSMIWTDFSSQEVPFVFIEVNGSVNTDPLTPEFLNVKSADLNKC